MTLVDYLNSKGLSASLIDVLLKSADAGVAVCNHMEPADGVKVSSANVSGDEQIALDVYADRIFTNTYNELSSVYAVASEEQEGIKVLNDNGIYTVAFDPLDGSSLVDVNFSVGSIIGVYESRDLIGCTGDDLVAAAYIIYGPMTLMVISFSDEVLLVWLKEGDYVLLPNKLEIVDDSKYFAPGNLKAANESLAYKNLVNYWIENSYKLRYSGGMVPDVHHILYKGGGVFCYPATKSQPNGKLRLVYECLPMAKIIEAAGGKSSDGQQSILLKKVESLHQTTPICVGSANEVNRFEEMGV